MAAPSTVDEFLDLVSRSGLVDPQHLQAYVLDRRLTSALPDSPGRLAEVLVRDGVLTRFQAEQLLLGKWRNFFLSGKYKILERLGEGGMGAAFLCEHKVMRRRVALKVLPAGRADDPAALERFHREARAAAHLHHPNIVTAHDVDQDGKLHFLVMEYVDGSSLDKIVKIRGPMSPPRAAQYIRQAALGLQHAHQAGLVHRDVKPGNLLVDRSGTVKILDLGLARFFREEADDLTRRHGEGTLGTTGYMAPEQAQDSHRVDARADVYGLGATFFFLLTGQGPVPPGAAAQRARHRPPPPPPVRSLRPDLPEGLAAVVDRMLAEDPAKRFPSAAEVAEALLPWAQVPVPPPDEAEMPHLSPAARGAEPSTPTPGPASTATGRPGSPGGGKVTDRPGPKRPAKATAAGPRRRWAVLAGLAGLAVLVAGGVVGLTLSKAGKGAGPPAPPERPAPRLRLLVPAYFYPAGKGRSQWDRLLHTGDASLVVAVVNPDSGPGKAADPRFVEVMDLARKAGLTLIGYVSTAYGKRPFPDVQADVDRWLRFYPQVQGFFFDEQASGADKVPYYADLYRWAKKRLPGALVVTSPGTLCAEDYLSHPAADVACLAEGSDEVAAYRPPAWAARYPPDRFAALARGIGPGEPMRRLLQELADKRVGYVYVTDSRAANPWSRLPDYWEAEVEVVRSLNEKGR